MNTLHARPNELSGLIASSPFMDHNPPPFLPRDEDFLVEGPGGRPRAYDVADLRLMGRTSLTVSMECADNPAVSNVEWTGVKLSSLLGGLADTDGEVVFESYDAGCSRSLPTAVLRDTPVLLAFVRDGRPIPAEDGGPVRVVVPGWCDAAWVRWLKKVSLSRHPREDGTAGPVAVIRPNSLITSVTGQYPVRVQGKAWSGRPLLGVELIVNGTPVEATITERTGRYGWVAWEKVLDLPSGKHRIGSRAYDVHSCQPEEATVNKLGHGDNAVKYVTLEV